MTTGAAPRGAPAVAGRREVDAYMKTLTPEARRRLEKLRATVLAAAPGAVEGFSYGVPAIRVSGKAVVCYAAAKAHFSLFPMSGGVLKTFASDLKPFDVSKGTIRFGYDRPLPAGLVRRIVKARLEELRAK
jgi:uncharacterized protein YdhG (YjbR/CyaY superfamily)